MERGFWLRPSVSIAIIAMLLALIAAHDFLSGPALNLSVAYFVPITYAAWALGRRSAVVTALVAEVATVLDQRTLFQTTGEMLLVGVSNVIVRLIIYLFVAEVTYRLVQSTRTAHIATEDLERTYARLDEDMKAGGLLQESLLGFTLPNVPGYGIGAVVEYAEPVGGDFADIGTLDGKIYVCVADISGKGTPAALFTTLLKHLLNQAHEQGVRGRQVVSALNSTLSRALPDDRFVSLIYAELDPATGELNYVNAGHPEGLIYRGNTGDIETVGPTSPIIGIDAADSAIKSASVTFNPGDMLVMYTDGATDSKTPDGRRLGDDYIRKLFRESTQLSAQKAVDNISTSIENATDVGYRDDLTIVCIKKDSDTAMSGS